MENNYEQLVKSLRECASDDPDCIYNCPYYNHDVCADDLKSDAADAIEALRKRLVSALTALHLANEKMGYYGIQPYTEADGDDMISDWVKTLVHEELEQQLPKRGEWIRIDKHTVQCPLCHRYLDLRGVNAGRGDANYCPNCGAKMEARE